MVPKFDSPPSTPNSFSQPRPRAPKSPGHLARIRVQNRRRAYLDRHAEYFQSSEHELADPLLYDHLIRRFQTPAEREAEGRSKGYARVLEGSLLRGEERLAKLREGTVGANGGQLDSETGTGSGTAGSHSNGVGAPGTTTTTTTATTTTTPFSTLTATLTTPPHTRAEGREQWEAYLRDRFIRGEDGDFDDYAKVDGDDEYDELERQAREEAWFEEEEAAWEVGDDEEGEEEGRGGKGGCGTGERVLEGETGVQDF
ncbi:coiled-coil domain-containing protein 97 [Dichotomopilus funicola]|uniref:Coiled-coil domain-containing protein 97 n=1 Tax=Dichotomopilus funicola TaxID=1934379 RepID=A0AAN6V2H1_9PEZI|nr:coiled-coil domain-containing protein 97 [Dichotomopilus funicola]